MKIPNYDSKQKKIKNIKLCDFLDEDFRMLIAGQTRCGKTNTLMHMIRKPLVYFDKIYYYGPNHNQEEIQDLKKIMDKISDHLLVIFVSLPNHINCLHLNTL